MVDPASFTGEGGTVFGEGQFGPERCELVYFSESESPWGPEDIFGPGLVLCRHAGATGSCGPMFGRSGPYVDVWRMYDPRSRLTCIYGQVAPEFDSVIVSCTDGPDVDVGVADCLDLFPFHYYVAMLPEPPTDATAFGEGVDPLTQQISGWIPPTGLPN